MAIVPVQCLPHFCRCLPAKVVSFVNCCVLDKFEDINQR